MSSIDFIFYRLNLKMVLFKYSIRIVAWESRKTISLLKSRINSDLLHSIGTEPRVSWNHSKCNRYLWRPKVQLPFLFLCTLDMFFETFVLLFNKMLIFRHDTLNKINYYTEDKKEGRRFVSVRTTEKKKNSLNIDWIIQRINQETSVINWNQSRDEESHFTEFLWTSIINSV